MPAVNRVRQFRLRKGWSQAQLAETAGISRAAVSAVEGCRLTTSVTAAMALAAALDCTVEDLFGSTRDSTKPPGWAFQPPALPWRYWQAEVGGRLLLYPVERMGATTFVHDGTCGLDLVGEGKHDKASRTLVMASCDPAAGLLATTYYQRTGHRLLVINRSSRTALEMLAQGLIHLAGIHFSTIESPDENRQLARYSVGDGHKLLRAATWEAGIAVAKGMTARTVRSLVKSRIRWVGREVGSGARRCLDKLLPADHEYICMAVDHRSVAEAISNGSADAGVCVRLASAEAGLNFMPVQQEFYDLCVPEKFERDPRLESLIATLRSTEYRRLIGEVPGYISADASEISIASRIA